jgi:hypothetical protein
MARQWNRNMSLWVGLLRIHEELIDEVVRKYEWEESDAGFLGTS